MSTCPTTNSPHCLAPGRRDGERGELPHRRSRAGSAWLLGRLALGCAVATPSLAGAEAAASIMHWKDQSQLALPLPAAGASVALLDTALVVAGLEPSSSPTHAGEIHVHARDGASSPEPVRLSLPQPVTFAAVTSDGDRGYLIGGRAGDATSSSAFEIARNGLEWRLERLPDLPSARSHGAATVFRRTLYFVGGRASDGQGSTAGWRLNLDAPSIERRWIPLPPLPPEISPGGAVAVQYWGDGYSLFSFGSRLDVAPSEVAVAEHKLGSDSWTIRASRPPAPSRPTFARPIGVQHVLVTFSGEAGPAWLFHTVTDTWLPLPEAGGQILAAASSGPRAQIVAAQGSDRLAIRDAVAPAARVRLPFVDYAVVAAYFLGMVLIGSLAARRRASSDDFFRAGRRLPGWAAGISLVATQLSAISYLSLPAKTFGTDWLYITAQIAAVLGSVLCAWTIVPRLYRLNITSAYEFVEQRYSPELRLFASALFCIFQVIRMGALILLPSVLVSLITGMGMFTCIVLIGAGATVYTYVGGLEAVVWTDVVQTIVMIGGMLIVIGTILSQVDLAPMALVQTAWADGKLRMANWSMDFTIPSMILILLYVPLFPGEFASNQNVVQRIVSTRNLREARRMMFMNALVGPGLVVLLLSIGTLLFYFYRQFPERLNPTMTQSDEVLAWFMVRELPPGCPGLLIAAIFAATMSSLDSGLSGVSTVVVRDFLSRFRRNAADATQLRWARSLVLGLGALGTGTAAIYATLEIQSLFDHFSRIFVLLLGTLGGVFLLGLWTRRVGNRAAVAGMIAGGVAMHLAGLRPSVHFFHYSLIGTGTSMLVAYALSWVPGFRRVTGETPVLQFNTSK